MTSIGERIKKAREDAELSQEAVAGWFNISREAVSKWESGESRPDQARLPVLARNLKRSIDWLVGADEPCAGKQEHPRKGVTFNEETEPKDDSMHEDIDALMREVAELPDRMVPTVLRVVRRLKASSKEGAGMRPPPKAGEAS